MSDGALKSGSIPNGRTPLEQAALNNILFCFGAILLAPIIATGLWPLASHEDLTIWLFSIFLLHSVDLVLSLVYLKQRTREDKTNRWQNLFIVDSAVIGISWSSAFFILHVPYPEFAVILLIFMIAGVTAFFAVARSSQVSSALVFEVCAIVPMSIWFFRQHGEFYSLMGVESLLYLGLILVLLRKLNQLSLRHQRLNERSMRLDKRHRQLVLELEQRERDFFTLAENLPDNVVRWSIDGKVLYANPLFLYAFGLPADSIGKVFSEVTGRMFEGSPSHTAFIKVIETEQKVSFRAPVQMPSGNEIHEIKLVPEFDAEGRLISVLGIGHDVTEFLLTERSLVEEKGFFAQIIDSVNDPLFVKDEAHRLVVVNKAFCELFDQSSDRLLDKSDYDFLPQNQADLVWEQDVKVFETGEDGLNEVPITMGDGRVLYLQTKRSLFTVGNKRYLVGVIRDLTERRLAELSLAHHEQEFRTLIENSRDTIARYDRRCRRIFANPALISMAGVDESELLGKTPGEWPGGEQAEVYENKMREVFANGTMLEFELSWRSKSGEELCSLISLTPEFDLEGKVERILAVGRDITELHTSREKIHQMAFYDGLTGLPNRALFNDRLDQMISDTKRHAQLAGVMMIDLDHFKEVNDTMGHAAGDELLQEFAGRLVSSLRACDTVARLSGDEFAILLPDVRSADDLGRVASKILGLFPLPFLLNDKEVFISGSIGIALVPSDSDKASDLLKYADAAMYHAKRSGRNGFRFYSRNLTSISNLRLALEADLRHAIERQELQLYYQPKIDLNSDRLIGSEALLRWCHPTHGMISPEKFIGIAEDSGQIHEIGEWVIRQACHCAANWNREGGMPHKVAINLSPRQFHASDLLGLMKLILSETGCLPEWIELEITERLLLEEDENGTHGILEGFRAIGITIAIDDFGTGYSALSYLARFPINTLKIDKSFTWQMVDSDYHAEVVKAILSIARSLGQRVVAEGVETVEQAEFLKQHGCHVGQGYLYGKPMTRQRFESLLIELRQD